MEGRQPVEMGVLFFKWKKVVIRPNAGYSNVLKKCSHGNLTMLIAA